MNNKTNPGLKIICLNRKASFNYFFEDLFEAGIVLKGSEIKSVRDGKVNIAESYAVEKGGEIVLINSLVGSVTFTNGSLTSSSQSFNNLAAYLTGLGLLSINIE